MTTKLPVLDRNAAFQCGGKKARFFQPPARANAKYYDAFDGVGKYLGRCDNAGNLLPESEQKKVMAEIAAAEKAEQEAAEEAEAAVSAAEAASEASESAEEDGDEVAA